MDNRQLLNNLINLEIKKLEHNEYLDEQNKINQEKENIKQKVFSIGLIDKSNETQIEKSINILYEQHLNYHEFIYKQINVLGGFYNKHSTNVLLKKIEIGIKKQSGEDFEEKMINYFIIKNLSKSYDKLIKIDFFYKFYITRYENKNKLFEKINHKIIEIKNKIEQLKLENNKFTKIEVDSNTNNQINIIKYEGNVNEISQINIIKDKLSLIKKINYIIGEMYITSRLNLYIIILFLLLKYKFDLQLDFYHFLIFLSSGIIIRLILNFIYDEEKLKQDLNKKEKNINDITTKQENEKNDIQDDINKYNNYVNSLKEFII